MVLSTAVTFLVVKSKKQLKHFKKSLDFFKFCQKNLFLIFFAKILNMAPGFWGPTTSTLDWCEKNYEVRKKLFPFKNVKKFLISLKFLEQERRVLHEPFSVINGLNKLECLHVTFSSLYNMLEAYPYICFD
jgi:hypothetical protein